MEVYLVLISLHALRTESKLWRSQSIGTNFPSGTASLSLSREATDRDDGRFSKRAVPLCFATVLAALNPVPDVVPAAESQKQKAIILSEANYVGPGQCGMARRFFILFGRH